MKFYRCNKRDVLSVLVALLFLLSLLVGCGTTGQTPSTGKSAATASPTAMPTPSPTSITIHIGRKQPPATPVPTTTSTPTPAASPTTPGRIDTSGKPVLAFYYTWYDLSTWSSTTMSALPVTPYVSSDDATIDRQLSQASQAGITGFISSWWGANDKTDHNFARLLDHAAALENTTGYRFTSSIYFECDAPALQGQSGIVQGLQYLASTYENNSHFFHWQGKPVIFFWNPLGNGRTLTEWSTIRSQVDPNHQQIWSAEGVDTNLLSVFDGLHLFSAAYWGIEHNDITQVDQGFRNQINSYNQAHQTQKIWAAGVLPGYDDTRVPGRQGTYIVPRNNGSTYQQSWQGAIASTPDWITITSFNEWFEGSMIEPASTYGNLYLTLTQQYSQQWRHT